MPQAAIYMPQINTFESIKVNYVHCNMIAEQVQAEQVHKLVQLLHAFIIIVPLIKDVGRISFQTLLKKGTITSANYIVGTERSSKIALMYYLFNFPLASLFENFYTGNIILVPMYR